MCVGRAELQYRETQMCGAKLYNTGERSFRFVMGNIPRLVRGAALNQRGPASLEIKRETARVKCLQAAVSIWSSCTSVILNVGREMKRRFYTAAPPKNTE